MPGPLACPAPERCDLAVVGGGIIGLAVAREVALRHPRVSVCVLEREPDLATHQTGHNSGVIHAGLYYAPGSLKARLCVEGARTTYAYAAERGIPHERCGKLVVARDRSELPRLEELARRGAANGVAGLRMLDGRALTEVEPHVRGFAALHSPDTAIVDFAAVARAYAGDLLAAGGAIATGCEVLSLDPRSRTIGLSHSHGTTEARNAILCAGAWSDRLAVAAGANPDPRIVPFRGSYLRLSPARRELVRALVYPVPDPSLPFLGVHLTRTVTGEVLVGPTALLAPARAARSAIPARARDLRETATWPGTWRMARRWWRAGMMELANAASRRAFAATAARYVPDLREADLEPAFFGLRAQAVARDGSLLDDFAFSATPRALHIRNAPSPAATSAPAIARHLAGLALRELDLGA